MGMSEISIRSNDLCGKWSMAPHDGVLTLTASSRYTMHRKNELLGEGTFQITEGTHLGSGRWISPTGYFIQFNEDIKQDRMPNIGLYQIEVCEYGRVEVRTPLKTEDGAYRDASFDLIRV